MPVLNNVIMMMRMVLVVCLVLTISSINLMAQQICVGGASARDRVDGPDGILGGPTAAKEIVVSESFKIKGQAISGWTFEEGKENASVEWSVDNEPGMMGGFISYRYSLNYNDNTDYDPVDGPGTATNWGWAISPEFNMGTTNFMITFWCSFEVDAAGDDRSLFVIHQSTAVYLTISFVEAFQFGTTWFRTDNFAAIADDITDASSDRNSIIDGENRRVISCSPSHNAYENASITVPCIGDSWHRHFIRVPDDLGMITLIFAFSADDVGNTNQGWFIDDLEIKSRIGNPFSPIPEVGVIPPPQHSSRQGCYVATAALGSPETTQVLALSDFRRKAIVNNPLGLALSDLYESKGRLLASFVSEKPLIKSMTGWIISSAVSWLSIRSIISTIAILFLLATISRRLRVH